jgi:hypothetical protein
MRVIRWEGGRQADAMQAKRRTARAGASGTAFFFPSANESNRELL